MSVGGLDTVVYSSVFNNQLSKEKQALICSSYQFHWCKYSHYDQFQATNLAAQNRKLGKDAQQYSITQYFRRTVPTDIIILRV